MSEPPAVAEGREKAEAVRYSNDLGTTPIRNVFEFIERTFPDMLVVRRPMPDGPEGALIRAGDVWLVIVNTAGRQLARQRFTAAHELGHRIFDGKRQAMYLEENLFAAGPAETRANAFAVNLLLPATELRDRVAARSVFLADDDDIVALAMEYGLSVLSLGYHLKNNRLITERRRQEIQGLRPIRAAARLGYRDQAREEMQARDVTRWPSRYVRLAYTAHERGLLSEADLDAILGEDQIESLHEDTAR